MSSETQAGESKPKRIERRPEVSLRTGLCTSALYAEMAAGRFPRPVRITAKAVGWRADEVDAWINSRPRVAK